MVLHRPVELAGIIGMWPKLPEAKKPVTDKSVYQDLFVKARLILFVNLAYSPALLIIVS